MSVALLRCVQRGDGVCLGREVIGLKVCASRNRVIRASLASSALASSVGPETITDPPDDIVLRVENRFLHVQALEPARGGIASRVFTTNASQSRPSSSQ